MSELTNKTDRCMFRQWWYDYKEFGKALKLARVAHDFTQDECAKYIGCSRSTYWKMEQGGFCSPRSMQLACEFLGVDLMQFNKPVV